VTPNPDLADVERWCAAAPEAWARAEVVVGLGGGSALDSAKALATARGSAARVHRALGGTLDGDPLPLLAIPTTAGTGSEVTSWATLWDRAGNRKHSLADRRLYPSHALVDPALMLSAPRGVTLASGLDALSHALESLWNVNANPVSAACAVSAARAILATLPALMADLGSLALRERMAQASLLAGLAFSNTKTALAHSLSYPLTLQRGVPHGIACSFSLPQVMRWALGISALCDESLAQIFGSDLPAGADRLEAFLEGLGVSTAIESYELDEPGWRALVADAMEGARGRNYIGRPAL